MSNEIWLPLIGYENTHAISNKLRIKSVGYCVDNGNGRRFVVPKIRKISTPSGSYPVIKLIHKARREHMHILVARQFIPNPENKPFINHKNGDKNDYRVVNLEWCTRQENENHAFATGLKNSTGSANSMAKLNEKLVFLIKVFNITGHSSKNMSNIFNVHRATIQRIVNGKIWKHVII